MKALVRKPFPEGAYGRRAAFGNVDHHVVRLSASQEFWEDRSEEVVGPARAAIEREHDLLARALSQRWGPAETVQLDDDGGAVAAFFGDGAETMLAWSCPEFDRWVGLAVVQADAELPYELFAGVSRGVDWPGRGAEPGSGGGNEDGGAGDGEGGGP
ncbi:hypothetical protein [Paractinoplanes lichenicola]|uniref:Uncharacterized protein n=1 Tax=Paractinoplanes lichenicola TaxID=2802976 RepID=A0ABS1VZK3_9ACTN|nr:hypothetical protein [Actinoplanes lichenicola]MBL7259884.1 hypothetical protein [Actinoplanes lichenicola]